jgi:hypothetical protein
VMERVKPAFYPPVREADELPQQAPLTAAQPKEGAA